MMTKHLIVTLSATLLCAGAWGAEDKPVELKSDTDRINYSVGYQMGGDFKRQGVALSPEAMVTGIKDALTGDTPLISQDEMRQTLVDLKGKIVAEQQEKAREALSRRIDEGKIFMTENAKKEGVITLPSGLQYKVIQEGTGKSPGPTDTVTVSYKGTLVDGTEFDSSYREGKPVKFPLNGVIKGWTEGLQHMKEGGKYQLFIPPELGYGERGPLADRTLIFDLELVSVGDN